MVARLAVTEHRVLAVGRDEQRLARLEGPIDRAIADLERPETLTAALAPAHRVLSLAPGRLAGPLLASVPAACDRVVLTGSTRRDGNEEDPVAAGARLAEAELARSGVAGIVLHPSMIYGARGDRSVGRLLSVVGRWPRRLPLVVPLPGSGRSTVQPVFVDDVADAMVAAILRPNVSGPPVFVVGPEPITYAYMVRSCASALGRKARIVPAPAWLLSGAARIVRAPVTAEELLRSGQSQRYDPTPMIDRLGVTPRAFADGLRLKLERETQSG